MFLCVYETLTNGEYKNKGYYIQEYQGVYPEYDGYVICSVATKKEAIEKCEEFMLNHPIKKPDYNWGLGAWNPVEYGKWMENWWPEIPDYSTTELVKCSYCNEEIHTYEAHQPICPEHNKFACSKCIGNKDLWDKIEKQIIKKIQLQKDFK